MNPQKYLESGHLPPWHNHVQDEKKLDYYQIRHAIDQKMTVIKKEFPLQTAVRAMQKRPKFEKKNHNIDLVYQNLLCVKLQTTKIA